MAIGNMPWPRVKFHACVRFSRPRPGPHASVHRTWFKFKMAIVFKLRFIFKFKFGVHFFLTRVTIPVARVVLGGVVVIAIVVVVVGAAVAVVVGLL